MIDQLVNLKPGFEDVTKLHFRLKRRHILKELLSWCNWTAEQAADAIAASASTAPSFERPLLAADISETRRLYVKLAALLNAL
jgi:hypothetical protein